MQPASITRDQSRVLALARAKRYAQTGEGRRIRLEHDLSLGELAGGVGVGITTIHRWEKGQNVPHGDAAVRWVELLEALAAADPLPAESDLVDGMRQ